MTTYHHLSTYHHEIQPDNWGAEEEEEGEGESRSNKKG